MQNVSKTQTQPKNQLTRHHQCDGREPQYSPPETRWLLEDPEEHQPLPKNQAPDAAWARLTSTSEKGLGENHPDGRRQSPKSVENLKSGTGEHKSGTGDPESGNEQEREHKAPQMPLGEPEGDWPP